MMDLVGSAVGVLQLDVGLLADAVQVLVKAVEQEGQQLVRVLLLVARELRREPAHLSLKTQTKRLTNIQQHNSGSEKEEKEMAEKCNFWVSELH